MTAERYILVAVHPKRPASAALLKARQLARATGTGLRLVTVQPPADPAEPGRRTVVPSLGADLEGTEVVHAEGQPAALIAAEAARADVEMVVIGQGRGPAWRRWMRRSLHRRLVGRVNVPVLIVRSIGGPRTRVNPSIEPAAPERDRSGRPALVVLSGRSRPSPPSELG